MKPVKVSYSELLRRKDKKTSGFERYEKTNHQKYGISRKRYAVFLY